MIEQDPMTSPTGESQARREFLARVSKTAVVGPAVALLLAASTRPLSAQYGPPPGGRPGPPPPRPRRRSPQRSPQR
jgi:hypothetical protein